MSYQYATLRGNIIPFTGNFTLRNEDAGKIFLCNDTANVTVTVPRDLIDGFNVGFVMYSTGTVTLAAAAGVVNKSGKTALSTQYQAGSLMVMKRIGPDGVLGGHEFLVGGDFA